MNSGLQSMIDAINRSDEPQDVKARAIDVVRRTYQDKMKEPDVQEPEDPLDVWNDGEPNEDNQKGKLKVQPCPNCGKSRTMQAITGTDFLACSNCGFVTKAVKQ